MKYGCIGERLGHSFSREIHNALGDYPYELCEVAKEELDTFVKRRDFSAINVTIPYKELIMPYLYYTDEHARLIGSVNTVVNREGRLYGYNTDFFGMTKLLEHAGVYVEGKKVVILGTGGTSKTAYAVTAALGARQVVRVSRTGREGAVDYSELYERHTDAEIIINTTPVGMYPRGGEWAVDIARFKSLTGVVDAIYNPLRTNIVIEAKRRGIPAEGGLYMLVAQAVRASEIFLDVTYPEDTTDRLYRRILKEKENIVLTGMPASGKSTVGRLLAELTGRELIDSDEEIVKKAGKSIPDIFAEDGELYFRELEREVIHGLSAKNGVIIATGGGAVLDGSNTEALKQNGRIYFIDRAPELLVPTPDRPLSSDSESMMQRYRERYPIYRNTCDLRVDADCSPRAVAEKILGDFRK